VLVVDDVRANLLAIEVLLEQLDCAVDMAESGDEALALLLRESYAVILLDVRMPRMDGFEVARHIRMRGPTRELPIIFMTADSPSDQQLQLGYDSGAVDFLFKPLNREVLRSKVRVFVELYSSRRELTDANLRLEAANTKLLALVDAEATASSALRQANDDLGLAYRDLRATQSQLIQTASLPSLSALSAEVARAAGPFSATLERLDAAAKSLSRLRESGILEESVEATADWEEARAHLNAASLQLTRMQTPSPEPREGTQALPHFDGVPRPRDEPRQRGKN
jgi:CheY-like chemotaxis protein